MCVCCIAGHPDPNAKYSIDSARAAGIEYVDVYMFPCPQCGNAAGQVKDMGEPTLLFSEVKLKI